MILDTCAWSQVEALRPTIAPHLARTLVVDHHLSGDIAAAHRWIDGSSAACAQMTAELIELLDENDESADTPATLWTPTVCLALYMGIATDTGWFHYSNTQPQTLELAAQLLRRGVDHADLFRRLEQTERPEKLALLTRALNSLQLLAANRVAVMVLRPEDFVATGAQTEETERFVDVPQMVQVVEVVVLVTQSPDDLSAGRIRVSLRSKPGPSAVNVADLAAQFGGGGHARAAGAKVKGDLTQVLARVRSVVSQVM